MELEHFGRFLKEGREEKGLSVPELSRATKIKESLIEHLEAGRLEQLPSQIYVRGFVGAYARAVGLDEAEALRRLRATCLRRGVAEPEVAVPHKAIQPAPIDEAEAPVERRRVGVVMVVLLILVVATLTLSLLLRHGGAAGAGLS